jgi:transposase
MAKHRSYSVEFKRQVAQEYLAGETLHGLAKRHRISRNLIRIWVARYEAGGFDDDMVAADIMQAQEARIAALERLVGKLTLENEFLKGASRAAALSLPRTTSARMNGAGRQNEAADAAPHGSARVAPTGHLCSRTSACAAGCSTRHSRVAHCAGGARRQ